MKFHLIAFGKLKSPGLRESADYYSKLLRTWHEYEETELKPESVSEKSPALRKQIQLKEGEDLLKLIEKRVSPRAKICILDETGKSMPTQQWSKWIGETQDQSVPEMIFCIASSLGFSDAVRKKAHIVLALGPQTFSHELARVVLLEQIYRGCSILKGHPYHNA